MAHACVKSNSNRKYTNNAPLCVPKHTWPGEKSEETIPSKKGHPKITMTSARWHGTMWTVFFTKPRKMLNAYFPPIAWNGDWTMILGELRGMTNRTASDSKRGNDRRNPHLATSIPSPPWRIPRGMEISHWESKWWARVLEEKYTPARILWRKANYWIFPAESMFFLTYPFDRPSIPHPPGNEFEGENQMKNNNWDPRRWAGVLDREKLRQNMPECNCKAIGKNARSSVTEAHMLWWRCIDSRQVCICGGAIKIYQIGILLIFFGEMFADEADFNRGRYNDNMANVWQILKHHQTNQFR